MLDIDFFKKVNDTHGHQAGDAILFALASKLKEVVREEDTVARYGGEEFLILLRGVQHSGAMALGGRIRRAVSDISVPWNDATIKVTVSIGVATQSTTPKYKTAQELVAAADEALYRAKNAGRDRIESAE